VIPKKGSRSDEEQVIKMKSTTAMCQHKTKIIRVTGQQTSGIRLEGRAWGFERIREQEQYSKGRGGRCKGRITASRECSSETNTTDGGHRPWNFEPSDLVRLSSTRAIPCDATKLVPQARAVCGSLPGAPQESDSNAPATPILVTGKILGGGGVRGAVRGAAWDENSKRRCVFCFTCRMWAPCGQLKQ
jgi:hypothetical protein